MNNALAHKIRAKKLGILLRDARLHTGHNTAVCAQILGISESVYQQYENGDQAPSLPEIETLSYFWEIPIEHFWGSAILGQQGALPREVKLEKMLALRQRMVGGLIRKYRTDGGISIEQLAAQLNISPEELTAYELAQRPIPLPVLEHIADLLNRTLRDFHDKKGPVGQWNAQQRATTHFRELSPEMQEFVIKPVNRPFLEIAHRLSQMPVDQLRVLAESLLEITL